MNWMADKVCIHRWGLADPQVHHGDGKEDAVAQEGEDDLESRILGQEVTAWVE